MGEFEAPQRLLCGADLCRVVVFLRRRPDGDAVLAGNPVGQPEQTRRQLFLALGVRTHRHSSDGDGHTPHVPSHVA
jgi:hypothetical protein